MTSVSDGTTEITSGSGELEAPLLSVIIVSYNTKELTLACLESVFTNQPDFPFEVVLVDNNSDDGSYEAIRDLYGHKICLIQPGKNLGFAGGNNLAVGSASGKYLLLLNPDAYLFDNALDGLMSLAAEVPEAKIWGGRTLFPDHTLNPSSCWGKQTLWSLCCQALGLNSLFRNSPVFNTEGLGGWDRIGERHVDIVSGCFFMIEKDFWESLGGFDQSYFMYGEEADLCLRAIKRGANPVVSDRATIVHIGGASDSVRTEKMTKLLSAKTRLIYAHFPRYSRGIAAKLLELWPLSRLAAHAALAACGRKQSRASMLEWAEIWRQRTSWAGEP